MKDSYKDLVCWDESNDEYYIDYPIGNQTLHMGFQLTGPNDDFHKDITYFNVWINLYNKRKDQLRNEDLHLSTGLNPIKTVLVARECFEAIVDTIIDDMQDNETDVVIYAHWVDNRRRDAYYRILKKYGYKYGYVPVEKTKVIMKKYKWNDYYEYEE